VFFFFFQAEDGIRDLIVTGVQTCALPISDGTGSHGQTCNTRPRSLGADCEEGEKEDREDEYRLPIPRAHGNLPPGLYGRSPSNEIGRASCRERVEIRVVAG